MMRKKVETKAMEKMERGKNIESKAVERKEHGMKKPGTPAQKKVEKVMHEYKEHTLKSGSGSPVTNRKQAIAIALSEASKEKKVMRKK